jgi:hypothetical protein
MAARKSIVAEAEELCREHFPLGWHTPHIWDTHTSVSCEHGQWTRDVGDHTGTPVTPAAPEKDAGQDAKDAKQDPGGE